jgi:hypothetical protein
MKLVRKARGKEATSTNEVSKESQKERDHQEDPELAR